ncbi:hypothetical protein COCSUDRAFT_40817 [Coccomyxa subellipsoidea C-169]|uniref:Integral membrane protein n=1 Tax=Coccomyxa subellipsoidea (strain C-169) TaxID=574566 RepID=I0Z193_COCSC|nr:hypothetical protein COCSUDRAFT_40817 [Coccomyxa subellipsoidea C-169]EIE24412.1 hypothetical protein COCSUDRAFT_40817 [Coccomyxa subellipsoidea C-169]|eukprot:XP_005648956.1 hypothetical protein COCSUDRAFT_40817 [Coccomyxa subellipsoidea C-169]
MQIHEDPNKHKVVRQWPRLWGWEFSNISWWVAQLFTWGSVAWCINGWYALFPLEDEARNTRIVGWSALVGGTLFEVGAYCMVVEAVNRGNAVRFGYEVKNLLESGLTHFHLARGSGYYSHSNGSGREMETVEDRRAVLDKDKGGKTGSGKPFANGAGNSDGATKKDTSGSGGQRWRWWGTRWNNLGYLASFVTMIGATIFWVSTIVGVPGVLPDESVHYVEWDILFWLTQVLGSCCFIAAAILFMLETQSSWWRIQPLNLGWQVGFWNLIGGLGFWLSGFFGFWAYPAGTHQKWGTALSTFWGAWAFLLGSYIQLFEMLN